MNKGSYLGCMGGGSLEQGGGAGSGVGEGVVGEHRSSVLCC